MKSANTTGKAGFELPPPPIPAKDIRETLTADVVVVGAGIAGLTAALSATQAGARTILIERGPTYNVRGLHNAAIASRLQQRAGIKIDKDQIISTIMEWGAYRSDQKLVKLWADNCDKVMDWLVDMAEAAGIEVVLDPTTKPWYFPRTAGGKRSPITVKAFAMITPAPIPCTPRKIIIWFMVLLRPHRTDARTKMTSPPI